MFCKKTKPPWRLTARRANPRQAIAETATLVGSAPANLITSMGTGVEALYYGAIGDTEAAAFYTNYSNEKFNEAGWGILTGITLGRARSVRKGVDAIENLSIIGRKSISADDFIGPTIGRSRFRNFNEFASAVEGVYQRGVNDAYIGALELKKLNLLEGNTNTAIGNYVDRGGARAVERFLFKENITEGPNSIIRMNRWLRDPSRSGLCVRPDIYIPGANRIFDATVGYKAFDSRQITRTHLFSGGALNTSIRPVTLPNGGSFTYIPKVIPGPK